ncbi:MAG: OmpH family outer membrane protein [Bacteroidetes bacterium]|nr:OmpH family outer membrane protein [Bacteroidota bacterium]
MKTKMRFAKIGAVAILFASVFSAPATAQSLKIGYADPDVIITFMPEYQDIQQQMAAEYRTSQEALQALAEDFQERVTKYQKQQPLLSTARQAEREAELAQLQTEIQDSAARKDQELAKKQEDLMAPLLDRVQEVIDEVAAAKGLDLVLRSPALLFVNEDSVININLDIAEQLGIEIDEEAQSD